eukprot:119439-Prorocentrum_minimum.AAC.1
MENRTNLDTIWTASERNPGLAQDKEHPSLDNRTNLDTLWTQSGRRPNGTLCAWQDKEHPSKYPSRAQNLHTIWIQSGHTLDPLRLAGQGAPVEISLTGAESGHSLHAIWTQSGHTLDPLRLAGQGAPVGGAGAVGGAAAPAGAADPAGAGCPSAARAGPAPVGGGLGGLLQAAPHARGGHRHPATGEGNEAVPIK